MFGTTEQESDGSSRLLTTQSRLPSQLANQSVRQGPLKDEPDLEGR